MTLLIDHAPPHLTFPTSWDAESRARLAALNITQEDVNDVEAALSAFRRARDELAVERYTARLADLRKTVSASRNILSPMLARRRALLRLSKGQRTHDHAIELEQLDTAISEEGWTFQNLSTELAAIERDYPLRLARLGIIKEKT